MATLERALPRLEKEMRKDKDLADKHRVAKRMYEWLCEGNRASRMEMTDEERDLLYDLHLLTMKPMLYVANVDEDTLGKELEPIDGNAPVPICAKVEADLVELEEAEAAEYLEAIGLSEPGLNRLAREAYKLLRAAILLHGR